MQVICSSQCSCRNPYHKNIQKCSLTIIVLALLSIAVSAGLGGSGIGNINSALIMGSVALVFLILGMICLHSSRHKKEKPIEKIRNEIVEKVMLQIYNNIPSLLDQYQKIQLCFKMGHKNLTLDIPAGLGYQDIQKRVSDICARIEDKEGECSIQFIDEIRCVKNHLEVTWFR